MCSKTLCSLVVLLGIINTQAILFSQNDTLILKNGNQIVGEIKKMSEGEIQIETDYSSSDFLIKWEEITYFSSEQIYLIILSSGNHYNGTLHSSANDSSKLVLNDFDSGKFPVDHDQIVNLRKVDKSILDRFNLSLSIGYNLTKANNNHQLSSRITTGYQAFNWVTDGYFGIVRGIQSIEEVQSITKRTEGGVGFKYLLKKRWFGTLSTDLLQSTEQLLALRAVTSAGIGNYIVNNQSMQLLIQAGAAHNFESYDDGITSDRNSAELFVGVDYHIFDLGDWKVKSSVFGYPSLTEKNRFRSDISFDLDYEFNFDLTFGIGFTINYDNQPVENGSKTDYVLQTTVGWKL